MTIPSRFLTGSESGQSAGAAAQVEHPLAIPDVTRKAIVGPPETPEGEQAHAEIVSAWSGFQNPH